jgi:hypothetical protein
MRNNRLLILVVLPYKNEILFLPLSLDNPLSPTSGIKGP